MTMVESYWNKTDHELYALLGAETLGDGLGESPEDEALHLTEPVH
ncbi:hypothetical protein [Streptomyces sp. NBC_00690]|nr:hypothetical protein [Streptomyces sp. NBC_00690]